MVLNFDQIKASKVMIKSILSRVMTDADLDRAMVIVDELYEKYQFRMEIYYHLKNRLQDEFKTIDEFTLYFLILPDIYKLFQTGLVHLDMFYHTGKQQ